MMKMKLQPYMIVLGVVMLFVVYQITNLQYQQTQVETRLRPFDSATDSHLASTKVDYLPRGIVQSSSDMELKPLWSAKSSSLEDDGQSHRSLLAIPAGIKQRRSVDAIVRKFLSENFTVILFHYDGNVNGWHDLEWFNSAIHVAAHNQTKWWFAKRFLHPDVVSIYDYIFLWDEDLGVENFHPGRWVEGMAPVFSRSAWRCTWHLIQNDLIHGWGMDMKLGYCAQGDRRKKVGVIDSEFVVHWGVPTLGGSSTSASDKSSNAANTNGARKKRGRSTADVRIESRRQAKSELQIFHDRWDKAARADAEWVDPFQRSGKRRKERVHLKSNTRPRGTLKRDF